MVRGRHTAAAWHSLPLPAQAPAPLTPCHAAATGPAGAAPCPLVCRGFKALKQIIKIQYKLGNYEAMLQAYRDLLAHSAVVTRNAAEKKINSVLDYVSQSTDTRLLQARRGGGGG